MRSVCDGSSWSRLGQDNKYSSCHVVSYIGVSVTEKEGCRRLGGSLAADSSRQTEQSRDPQTSAAPQHGRQSNKPGSGNLPSVSSVQQSCQSALRTSLEHRCWANRTAFHRYKHWLVANGQQSTRQDQLPVRDNVSL